MTFQLTTQAILWGPDSSAPSEADFVPAQNSWVKPKSGTGLWSSTYTDDISLSGWAQWCSGENFATGVKRLWLCDVRDDANIYVIDTEVDLKQMLSDFSVGDKFRSSPDFVALRAAGFDALYLTDKGQWETRLSFPHNLYGWDCESTCWLNWAFTDVRDGGVVEVKSAEYDWDDSESAT